MTEKHLKAAEEKVGRDEVADMLTSKQMQMRDSFRCFISKWSAIDFQGSCTHNYQTLLVLLPNFISIQSLLEP